MKKRLLFLIAVLTSSAIFAQTQTDSSKTKHWSYKGLSGVNFTQVALKNWNGGGNSALSANLLGTYSATYVKGKTKWENTLNAAYGIQNTEENGTRKTDDKVEFVSKYNREAFKTWSYASVFNFRSQFAPGYDYPNDTTRNKISDWLAPGYLNLSVGLENKPVKWLTIYISPISSKMTVVKDKNLQAIGAFGVDTNKTVRVEFGGLVRIGIDAQIMENVTYTSTLEMFSNYGNNPGNIDINWDHLIACKVNKYLTASLSATFIYDHDIKLPIDSDEDGTVDYSAPRMQIKQVLSLGLQYKF